MGLRISFNILIDEFIERSTRLYPKGLLRGLKDLSRVERRGVIWGVEIEKL